jgi:hypothetical protein
MPRTDAHEAKCPNAHDNGQLTMSHELGSKIGDPDAD